MKVSTCFPWVKKRKTSSNCNKGNSLKMSELTSNVLTESYEGQLSKYTNVVKGWQFRWFILDHKTGFLNYYLMENEKENSPRGKIHLRSAVISPSDDDHNAFVVKPIIGEVFKLRAQDARSRQEWVTRLRIASQFYANKTNEGDQEKADMNQPSTSAIPSVTDAFNSVRDYLDKAQRSSMLLSSSIDELPTSGQVTHTDKDILMLKASSQSTVTCLNQCFHILKHLSNDISSDVVNRSPKTEQAHSSKKMTT